MRKLQIRISAEHFNQSRQRAALSWSIENAALTHQVVMHYSPPYSVAQFDMSLVGPVHHHIFDDANPLTVIGYMLNHIRPGDTG